MPWLHSQLQRKPCLLAPLLMLMSMHSVVVSYAAVNCSRLHYTVLHAALQWNNYLVSSTSVEEILTSAATHQKIGADINCWLGRGMGEALQEDAGIKPNHKMTWTRLQSSPWFGFSSCKFWQKQVPFSMTMDLHFLDSRKTLVRQTYKVSS